MKEIQNWSPNDAIYLFFLPQLTKGQRSARSGPQRSRLTCNQGKTLPTILSWKTGIRRNVLKRIEPSLVLSLHQSLTSFLIRLGYGDFHSCERLQRAGIFYFWPEWHTMLIILFIFVLIILERVFSESPALKGPASYRLLTELLCFSEANSPPPKVFVFLF